MDKKFYRYDFQQNGFVKLNLSQNATVWSMVQQKVLID